ncbi:TadE/TadG family type IV pilus assembly protein [Atopobiaceae bacterium 24-176]
MNDEGQLSRLLEEGGQSTVEYALVLSAFLAMVVALVALWRFFGQGEGADLVARSASHGLGAGSVAALQDILLY